MSRTSKADLPRLRVGETAEELRHATWLELLYDLVFVVAVAELAHLLADDLSISGTLAFAGLFVPVWWAWTGQTFYANRFDTDDTVHRLMSVAQLLAVALLASAIGHVDERGHVFALAYAAVRFVLVLEYVRARRYVPAARPLIDHYLAGFSLAVALWVLSVAFEDTTRYTIWGIALVVDLTTPLLSRKQQAGLPPQSQHLPERFGLFVVIVLGEAVAGIVKGLVDNDGVLIPLAIAAAGIVVVVAIWWVYFADLAEAVTARTRFAGQVWVYGHLALFISVTATGVGIEHAIAHPDLDRPTAWLLPLAVAGAFLSLALLHAASSQWVRTLPRLAGAALCVLAAVFGGAVPVLALLVPTVVAAVQLLLELTPERRARYFQEREEAALEELEEDVEELQERGVRVPDMGGPPVPGQAGRGQVGAGPSAS
ncbi:MAG: hypothetical protein JWN57_2094 [Frankiales bacterium]|nr:hypothetical protein [Frankiales bacterium]